MLLGIKGIPVQTIDFIGVNGIAKPMVTRQNPIAFHFPDIVFMGLKTRHIEARDQLEFRLNVQKITIRDNKTMKDTFDITRSPSRPWF